MRKDPLNLDVSAPSAQPFDASETFTTGAQQVILQAQELARTVGSERVESVHLLLGALQLEPPDAQLNALFQLSSLKLEEVRLYAQSALESQQPLAPDALPRLSESARRTIRLAGTEARRTSSDRVDVSHFVIACFRPQTSPDLAEVLAPLGVSADQLSLHLRGLARGETATAIQSESPLAQLTEHGERALEAAHVAMRASFCGRISTLHLLIGVLENPDSDAVAALQTLMINVEELRQQARAAQTNDGEIAGPQRRFTPAAKRALDRAKASVREGGRNYIGSADLLLGLLPQPTLLIERAQFGANPDDPAAALLRDVDANLVRAIFNGERAPIPIPKEHSTRENMSDERGKMFVTFFLFQLSIGIAIVSLSWGQSSAAISEIETWARWISLAILIGCGLVSCAMTLFSKSAPRKANWQWGFFGAFVGMLVGLVVSGGLK